MSLINDSILISISVLHIMVVLFILMAPFSDNNGLIFLHTVVVPFIIIHWIFNNNNCFLTLLEKHIKKISHGIKSPRNDTFIYQFISPIYSFNSDHENYSTFIYCFTIMLWLISVFHIGTGIASGKIGPDDMFLFK
jgi:hypothetical protein